MSVRGAARVRSAARAGRTARPVAGGRRQWSGLWFVAPALLLYGGLILYPAGRTVNLSLWRWDGVNQATWRGWANYVDVLTDPILRGSILHAGVLVIFFSLVPVGLGLVWAALLTRRRIKGLAVFRLVFFLPQILPLVAVGVVWRWALSPQGLVNQVLGWFGLDQGRAWLGEWDYALIAIGLIGAWVQSGLCMMLFMAGCGRIDRDLYEAARLDGAGPVREFWSVTRPGLRSEIGLALTVTVISALASFDIVFVTTNGSPGHRTDVPGLLVYQRLMAGDLGHAAALAVVLSGLVLVAALAAGRLAQGREDR
ncbi:MAG: sugar ABC transporter permease [Propionibacteriaceae bacterium]|jgi:raffinose/stachyose/melibiose transport system permease protein|nr:sugar ABC transporter permease [Propionibacteriaceae bacterium]